MNHNVFICSCVQMSSNNQCICTNRHFIFSFTEECAQPAKRSPEVKPEVSCSPQYVQLRPVGSNKTPELKEEISGNPTANKTIARVEPDARGKEVLICQIQRVFISIKSQGIF